MGSWSDCPECGKCKQVPYNTHAEGRGNAYWFNCFDCGYWENYSDEIYDEESDEYITADWEVRSGYETAVLCVECNRGMRVSKRFPAGTDPQKDPPEFTEYSCGCCFFSFKINHQEKDTITIVRKPLRDTEVLKAQQAGLTEMPERFTDYPIGYGESP